MTQSRREGYPMPEPSTSAPLDIHSFSAPPEWVLDALCASTDPEAFFPDKAGSSRTGKDVCRRCPVAAECLDYALEHEERFGIWGGLSERERRKLAKTLGKDSPNETDQEEAPR